jgi:hypothetical protein
MAQAKKILAGHHPDEAKVVEVWISQLPVSGSRWGGKYWNLVKQAGFND